MIAAKHFSTILDTSVLWTRNWNANDENDSPVARYLKINIFFLLFQAISSRRNGALCAIITFGARARKQPDQLPPPKPSREMKR